MKKILVFQFRMDESLDHERECILKKGNFKNNDLCFVNVMDYKSILPRVSDIKNYSGIILGGSGSIDLTNWNDKDKQKIYRIKSFLTKAIEKDIPTLGICFGHQLIACFLEGKVSKDERQAESGTFEIILNSEGKKSPLFKNVPLRFYAVLGHKDSVTKLPKGAKLLATSKKCGVEAYVINKNVFGVQFHPELDKSGMRYRLNLFPTYKNGESIDEILKDYKNTRFSTLVINNFKELLISQNR